MVVLSQFLEDRYALDLVGDRAGGVGYLLKDRVGDLALFTDAVGASRVAARPSIPRSCSGWSAGDERTARSTT